MKVGSLFAGIGGFDLGLERAGFEIAWQVEINPYCQLVLAKHWPHVQRYGDIRTIDWATVPRVDVLCGGFPCQDLSFAGKRAGIDGERSGLWSEYVRAIRALRPRFVIVENVPGLLTNQYMGRVLGDLAASGYDAEWDCLPASAFGAPHRRDRVWLVAYAGSIESGRVPDIKREAVCEAGHGGETLAHSECSGWRKSGALADASRQSFREEKRKEGASIFGSSGNALADTSEQQRDRWLHWTCGWEREPQEALRDARGRGREEAWMSIPESLLGRVAHGIPHRVDRLRGLGNAIVPQIAEWIGRQIMKVEANGTADHR